MPAFNVKLADLGIDARFEAPAFGALRQEGQRVIDTIYAALVPFGIDLSNVTFGQTGPLADRNIYFGLPVLNAGVKLTVGRMEIGFNDLVKVNFDLIRNVIQAAHGALEASGLGAKIATYAATLNCHGTVEGVAGRDFIKPLLARIPEGLGPSIASGTVFYFGAQEHRTNLALVLDASAMVTDGLYARVIFTLDGKRVRFQDLGEVGRESIRQAFRALDLQVDSL